MATRKRTESHVAGQWTVLGLASLYSSFPVLSPPVSFSPIASSTLINLELLFEIWLVTQARRAGP